MILFANHDALTRPLSFPGNLTWGRVLEDETGERQFVGDLTTGGSITRRTVLTRTGQDGTFKASACGSNIYDENWTSGEGCSANARSLYCFERY